MDSTAALNVLPRGIWAVISVLRLKRCDDNELLPSSSEDSDTGGNSGIGANSAGVSVLSSIVNGV